MFRAFRRHWKEAVNGIRRHWAMSISACFAITLTLALMSILLLVILNLSQITMDLQEEVKVFVKIDNVVEDSAIPSIQNQILSIEGVSEVEYSSKDNELDKLEEEFGESGQMFEIYRENNPLSRAFIVSVEQGYSIADISSKVATIEGVTEADFGGATTERYIEGLSQVRNGGAIVIIALTALAIFLVANTIKITIYAREEETAIMRFVGATNGYIRGPFLLEGIFLGILGAIIPVILTIFGYDAFYNMMGGKLITGILQLLPVFPFVGYLSGGLVAMGVIVGFIGSLISVNRNLRWKR